KAEGMAAKLLRDRLDVVSDYAAPLSRAVASEFLGFDDDAVVAILTAYGASLRTASPLTEFIVTLDRIADRSAIYSRLMNDGDRVVSDAEVRSLVRLLWLAATMTTERTITRAVLRLLQHDDVRRAVSADLALLPALAEEVLRLHPPEHTVPRMTTQPLQLGGVTLPAGALVQLCVSAANRDPARFEDPAALRLDRPAARHFTFGSGVHRCIGAPLARNVVGIALKTLL
ncbi:MAG TPA: cytochrome P450, partial [Thermoanaerobaculia bacterium]